MPVPSIVLALLPLAAPAQADVLYATTTNGDLVTIDATDPSSVTTVGPLGLPPSMAVTELTYHPSFNRLYGIGLQPGAGGSTDAYLVDIDPASGTGFVDRLLMNSAATGHVEGLEYVHSIGTVVMAHSDGGQSDHSSGQYAIIQLSHGAVLPLSSSTLDTDAMVHVPSTDTLCSLDPHGAGWARVDLQTGASAPLGPALQSVGDLTYGPEAGCLYGIDTQTLQLLRFELVGGGVDVGPAVPVGVIAGDDVLALAAVSRRRVGAPFCPAVPNSTGSTSELRAFGSETATENRLRLGAYDLPPHVFGLFVVSRTSGFMAQPGGSEGNLCLGGFIGRYTAPGQIQSSGVLGAITLDLDLGAIPQPSSFASVDAGDAWFFQCWHRDVVGGAQTSNFTPAVEVQFN